MLLLYFNHQFVISVRCIPDRVSPIQHSLHLLFQLQHLPFLGAWVINSEADRCLAVCFRITMTKIDSDFYNKSMFPKYLLKRVNF